MAHRLPQEGVVEAHHAPPGRTGGPAGRRSDGRSRPGSGAAPPGGVGGQDGLLEGVGGVHQSQAGELPAQLAAGPQHLLAVEVAGEEEVAVLGQALPQGLRPAPGGGAVLGGRDEVIERRSSPNASGSAPAPGRRRLDRGPLPSLTPPGARARAGAPHRSGAFGRVPGSSLRERPAIVRGDFRRRAPAQGPMGRGGIAEGSRA